jgi:3-dehydro-L-gulonate 2-dehydrogenase
MPRVSFEELKSECKRVLLRKRCPDHLAELSARLFAETTRDGVYSHGVNRFPRLIGHIDKGFVKVDATPTKVEALGALERWDGNLGLGNVNATLAMDRAIELAHSHGIGCVALRNTNHWMRGGTYGWQAAEAGCIGLCWTNTLPNMPAWGAKDQRLGNNPLIVAVPRAEGHVVVDMAMAQFSYGALDNAKRKGETLSVPGGYDQAGTLSTDPGAVEATGRVLPIGYWKGSSLALLLDLVATVLSGGLSTFRIGQFGENERGQSQVFIAMDATRMAGRDFLAQAVNEVVADLKGSQPASEGQEIRYPGERDLRIREENRRLGIPVEDATWSLIKSL